MADIEGHTVTFLTSRQIRPPFTVECPGFSAPSASFDGSGCVTSGLLFQCDKFTVVFPVAGNFKLGCLVHVGMTGTIHVLDPSQSLPHDQAFYDDEAQILSETGKPEARRLPEVGSGSVSEPLNLNRQSTVRE